MGVEMFSYGNSHGGYNGPSMIAHAMGIYSDIGYGYISADCKGFHPKNRWHRMSVTTYNPPSNEENPPIKAAMERDC